MARRETGHMRSICLALMTGAMLLQGAITFSVEAPGVQQTTLVNTIVESFDVLPAGPISMYLAPLGVYSGGMTVSEPNAWGGAGQTRYLAVGAQSGSTSYELNLFSPQTYFGLYWSAGDAKNELRFFNGSTLLASFRTADVMGGLSAAYIGNPNTGQNMGEKYAFFNFSASGGTAFNRIVFFNDGTGTGFETDNHTFLFPRDPVTPAAEAPEPATVLLMGLSFAGLGVWRRAKRAAR